MDFIETEDNDIELNGDVVVRAYSMTSEDFLRFSYELRNASRQHKVAAIRTLDNHIMDVEDFISYEQGLLKQSLGSKG